MYSRSLRRAADPVLPPGLQRQCPARAHAGPVTGARAAAQGGGQEPRITGIREPHAQDAPQGGGRGGGQAGKRDVRRAITCFTLGFVGAWHRRQIMTKAFYDSSLWGTGVGDVCMAG